MSTQPATWKWKRQLLSESRPSGLTDKVFRIFDGGILYLWYGEPTNYFCLKLGILPTIDSNLKTSHISISLQIWSERPGTRLPDDRWCWGSAGPEGSGALHCNALWGPPRVLRMPGSWILRRRSPGLNPKKLTIDWESETLQVYSSVSRTFAIWWEFELISFDSNCALMPQHLKMNLAYQPKLTFTKVLGIEKTPPPPHVEKIPK